MTTLFGLGRAKLLLGGVWSDGSALRGNRLRGGELGDWTRVRVGELGVRELERVARINGLGRVGELAS